MTLKLRRILFVVVGGFLLLLVIEAGLYNWRLLLAMEYRNLAELSRQLICRKDELLVERAALMSPSRLQRVGSALGLQPLPLESISVFDNGERISGGGDYVCMEH